MNESVIGRAARAYIDRYDLCLVQIPPGKKAPLHDGWNRPGGYFEDEAEAGAFFDAHPSYNMGVVLGPSRLCSLDIDDTECARIVLSEFGVELEQLQQTFPTIQGNPARCRIMFAVPEGITLGRHALTWPRRDDPAKRMTVLELRAGDVQDVFPPSIHPDTGQPYRWLKKPNGRFYDIPASLLAIWTNWSIFKVQAEDLCPWAPKQERLPAAPRREHQGDSMIAKFNARHDIVSTLTRYGYTKAGKRFLSPHSGTKLPGVVVLEDGTHAWIHHASDPLCSDTSGQPVNAFDLFCHYEHGGNASAAAKAAYRAIEGEAPKLRLSAPAIAPQRPDTPAGEPPAELRYRLMTAGQVAALPPVRWRIRGAIPEVGVIAFYGASGSGKTFLALDSTAAIGADRGHWFGQRVTPCPVTYLALEGEAGIAQRIRAYVQENGAIPDTVRFITQPFGLRHMDDIVAVGAAMKAVEAVDGVTVIDTLNRAAGGADENDSRDMSELIEGAKHLQAIVGGVIVLIHHSGKDASKGMRGHSSLIAALDAAIEVNRTDAGRTWRLAKSKDGADGEEHPFTLRVVDLGEDENGDPITSCVVDELSSAEPVRRRMGPIAGKNQKIVWAKIQPLFDAATDFGKGDHPGRPCLKLEQVYEALTPFFPEMDAKRRLARVKDAVEGLVASGRLCCKNDWLWLA